MNLPFANLTKRISKFFREAGGSSAQITNTNLKNFVIKHVGWNSDSDDYAASENDLTEVQSAITTDSYIKVALDKTAQLVMKSGYKFDTNNEAAMEYVRQRLAMMEFGTGVPFDVLLTEIARNLVYYSNCFVVKSRIDKIQGGLQAKAVLGKKPVGGYFIMDPTIVEIKRSSDGTIEGYKLTGTEETEFAANDVIHFYIDRDAGNNFGTPRIISVLEDAKILRKIEGSSLSLIYRFAIPLYQMKIGLPEQNFMATNQEISEAQDAIKKMPMDGVIVTNERTQFLAVGADGKAIDLAPYLDYFEKRVFTGLNISEAMMGRGDSSSNADAMEGLMHDTVKHYQAAMKTFIETGIFNEILLEGGYNPIFNIDDQVHFVFNEINLDTRVKIENHLLNQYQNNAITFEEMRMGFGRKTEADEVRLYTNMITTPSEIAVVQAKLGGGTSGGNLTNGKTSSKNGNGQAKSVVQPSNQHGTTSAKMGESIAELGVTQQTQKDLAESADYKSDNIRRQRVLTYRMLNPSLYNIYKDMRNNILQKKKFSDSDIKKYQTEFCDTFDKQLVEYSKLGYSQSILSNNMLEQPIPEVPKEITKQVHKQMEHLVKDIAKFVNSGNTDIETCFEHMEYRLRFACDYMLNKAFNYALLTGYRYQGIKQVKIKLSDGHKKMPDKIVTNNIEIDKIPPFNPYCSCEIIKPEVQQK